MSTGDQRVSAASALATCSTPTASAPLLGASHVLDEPHTSNIRLHRRRRLAEANGFGLGKQPGVAGDLEDDDWSRGLCQSHPDRYRAIRGESATGLGLAALLKGMKRARCDA